MESQLNNYTAEELLDFYNRRIEVFEYKAQKSMTLFYQNISPKIAAYLYKQGCSVEDVKGIIHSVFLNFLSRKQEFSTDNKKNTILPYMIKMAQKSYVRTFSLNESARKVSYDNLEIVAMDETEGKLNVEILYKHLSHFYNQLPKRDRDILFLVIEGYNSKEISEKLGQNEVTIRQRIARAKRRLKELFKQSGYLYF